MRDLSPPGDLLTQQTLPFEFNNVEMQYDSYKGLQVGRALAAALPDCAARCP